MQALNKLAQACALLATLLLVVVTLIVCASIFGREAFGKTIPGDLELIASAAGAAIALFMPWCQIQRGHIIVDFFTARSSPAAQSGLDRLGALLLAVFLAFVAWRTGIGGMNAWTANEGTMMLGFPNWIVYACITPGLALTALIALAQAAFGFEQRAGAAA
jgi:TRAP-type C4-dicarboxylate transport system permease small subunit